MKAKYVKPMLIIIGALPCTVVCGSSSIRANWGNQDESWADEGWIPGGNPSGVPVDDDEGVISSRSKQNAWTAWDD